MPFSSIKAPVTSEAPAPEREREPTGEQLGLLQADTSYGLLANVVMAGVGFASLWPVSAGGHMITWLTYVILALGVRYVLHRGYTAASQQLGHNRYWRILVIASCGAIGVGWGWFGLFLFPAADVKFQLITLMVLAVAVATVHTVAPFHAAAAAFLVPTVLPAMTRLAVEDARWAVSGALLCVMACFVWWSLLRQRSELSQRVRLRYQQDWAESERAVYMRSVETANRLFAQVMVERERIEAELKVAKQTAEEASRAKGEFLAYTSHEIRTPLAAIIGFTRELADTPLTAQQRDHLRRVRNAGNRLLSLINDLLDMSKMEAGKLELECVDFELRALLDEIVQEQLINATEKNLLLDLEVASDAPDHLMGDPLRLRQVLVNLVGNAIKFTWKGKIGIRVAVPQRDGDAACRLRFSVIDTGIGVPPDKQERIFQKYSQADAGTSRAYGGTGLGLAISKSLVELMGGTIGFRSKVDEGSEFFFDLPFTLAAAAPAAAEPAATAMLAGGRPLNVLVAEDNEDNQLLIELMLRKKGAYVTLVDNGEKALKQLEQGGFDIALLDLEMPVMGGLEVVTALREREKQSGRRIPVVALSAHALVGYGEKCFAAGMDGYITKPIDPDTLYAAMDKLAGDETGEARTRAGAAP